MNFSDLSTAFANVHWLSVIVAAISAFIIGGIWYGPIYGRPWMKELGFLEEDLQKRSIKTTYGVSLILTFIAALVLEICIGPEATWLSGALFGFIAGLGWVATFLGVLYLFEMKTFRLFFINAFYCVITLTAMGLILGAW
jgi:hypothetical protein